MNQGVFNVSFHHQPPSKEANSHEYEQLYEEPILPERCSTPPDRSPVWNHELTIREAAVARMKDHGVTPINWTTVAAELQRDWRLATGKDLGRVFHDHYHSYGLLRDSFEFATANVVKKAS